jgi:hypothetical protein
MLTRLLPILPLLLCPLLMLVCMWAMRYMGNGETPQGRTRTGAQEMPAAARVAELERELADLRRRLPATDSSGMESLDAATHRPNDVESPAPGATELTGQR